MQCIGMGRKGKFFLFLCVAYKKGRDNMEGPKSYNCSVCGSTFTAQDANGDINPAEIQSAVETFKTSVEDALRGVVTSLVAVEPDVGDSVKVQNATLVPQVEQVCDNIKTVGSDIAAAVDAAQLYQKAIIVHDNIQRAYNAKAAASASACAASHQTETTGTSA